MTGNIAHATKIRNLHVGYDNTFEQKSRIQIHSCEYHLIRESVDSLYPDKLQVDSTTKGRNMKPRISMVTLGVADLARSVKFYEQGLGFPRMESPPEVAFFTLNGTWLGLYDRDALAEDATVSGEGSGFRGIALAHNVASESEVDDVLAEAVAAGATLVKPGQKVFWGGYSGYFADPDGHLWEVAHNPFAWVGPKDPE